MDKYWEAEKKALKKASTQDHPVGLTLVCKALNAETSPSKTIA